MFNDLSSPLALLRSRRSARPRDLVEPTMEILRSRMEGAAELSVPLVVETGIGANWLECK